MNMFKPVYTFETTEKAEDFLEDNGFVWSYNNAHCYNDEWNASIVDYGHKAVVSIWKS